jgi:drug/metabolite transporter (DMT)-like permease
VLAAIIAYLFLGEKLGIYQVISGIIVVAGIFFVHHSREKLLKK